MEKIEFFSMARRNPFRRVIVEAGDSIVAISQPITVITSESTAWKWLKYLGHEGD